MPTVISKYGLNKSKTFNQFLEAYDKAFNDLNILVYIFIDELDKVVTSDMPQQNIRAFLEDLKLISDKCSHSISLLIAGTPNCLVAMNNISIDYKQRFEIIVNNFLNFDQTKKYIQNKCALKLKYVGHYPFDNLVIKKISEITDGNIRKIEALCRDLWIYSYHKKRKIDASTFDHYMNEKLYEPVKNVIGERIGDGIISFISLLFLNNGRIATRRLASFPMNKRREIEPFIEANPQIIRLNARSYVLDRNVKDEISNNLVN